MTGIGEALNVAAPFYNLALVAVVLVLFWRLFSIKNRGTSLRPWKLVLFGVIIFIVEELITILRSLGVITIGRYINGFFELAIIILFIYTLLEQKEVLKKGKKK